MNLRLVTFVAATVLATATAAPIIHPNVHRALKKDAKVNVIVTMKGQNTKTLEKLEEKEYITRSDKINDLVAKLKADNVPATAPVTKLLNSQHEGGEPAFVKSKNYWISNQIYIEGATASLIDQLKKTESVYEVREQIVIQLEKPIIERESQFELMGQEWGVKLIQAPKVWADGITGQNVIVANIDSGVRHTHEAIRSNWVGSANYGWYDPELQSELPYDNNGHGSHTMGTIAGTKGVGVAPGAKWLACKACRDDGCPESDLLDCAQFVVCPHDTFGENPDCSKAPRVVSNSWGGGQGETFYRAAVNAWIKAGIVPVFANGNEGPACTTVSSPGDYPNVIGVGATNSTDGLAYFSSKGPSVKGRMKPDISAPGHRVRSVWNDADHGYKTISGTSMATPHVSGAVALLLSSNPEYTIDDIKVRLYTTTDQSGLQGSGYTCGGTSDAAWPNNQFGHGRLNILNAYEGFRPAPTQGPTPTPTTKAPTPTPSPTSSNDAFCAGFKKGWMCELFDDKCYWDGSVCKGKN